MGANERLLEAAKILAEDDEEMENFVVCYQHEDDPDKRFDLKIEIANRLLDILEIETPEGEEG